MNAKKEQIHVKMIHIPPTLFKKRNSTEKDSMPYYFIYTIKRVHATHAKYSNQPPS
jgi:hypothetical protein